MTASKAASSLDLSRISFPTDKLSVEDVRAAENAIDGFDGREGGFFSNLEAMIVTERLLARRAYEATLGGAKPNRVGRNDIEAAVERRDAIGGMDADYRRYGLSTGAKHTVELIRGIESQAATQAKVILGEGR